MTSHPIFRSRLVIFGHVLQHFPGAILLVAEGKAGCPWADRNVFLASCFRSNSPRSTTIIIPHPKAEAFRKRLLGPEQPHLFACFRHPRVPPTNNQAERSLRPVVIMRKIIHGTRSAKGLENHSVLRSLFETARRQGKPPHAFFFQLFTQDTAQAQAALYRHPPVSPILRC